MIEDSIWQRFPEDVRRHLQRCIAELAQSGILMQQATLELTRLVDGDPAENVDDLCKNILRVRADTRGLQLLHNYGLQLTQELDSEN